MLPNKTNSEPQNLINCKDESYDLLLQVRSKETKFIVNKIENELDKLTCNLSDIDKKFALYFEQVFHSVHNTYVFHLHYYNAGHYTDHSHLRNFQKWIDMDIENDSSLDNSRDIITHLSMQDRIYITRIRIQKTCLKTIIFYT
jgi:hypothetical protein